MRGFFSNGFLGAAESFVPPVSKPVLWSAVLQTPSFPNAAASFKHIYALSSQPLKHLWYSDLDWWKQDAEKQRAPVEPGFSEGVLA